jgi:isoleucyl-tRNA synthetase
MDGLSTWYVRLSRERMRRNDDAADRAAAFATLHEALLATAGMLAPILPFLSDSMYGNLVADATDQPDSVHLTRWPTSSLAAYRDVRLERAMEVARDAVDLARTLRSSARIRTRQPLAQAWLALPDRGLDVGRKLLAIIADEINVKVVSVIADDSDLVERRVKPLLPRIGKRLGAAIPAVMAAARDGSATFHPDGSVTLGGVTLAPDEVEIQASPRPGTAVADRDGLVMVIDTELTPELRAEGDARELQRAVQDLRRDAGLALDDRIDLWIDGLAPPVAAHLDGVLRETLATLADGPAPADVTARATVELESGSAAIALRRRVGDG